MSTWASRRLQRWMYDREQVFFELVLRLPGIPSSYGRLESNRGALPLGCKYQLPEPPVNPWEPSPDPSSSPERKCSQGTGQKSFPTFIIISNPLSPGARHTDDVDWAVGLFPSLYLSHQERRKTLEIYSKLSSQVNMKRIQFHYYILKHHLLLLFIVIWH